MSEQFEQIRNAVVDGKHNEIEGLVEKVIQDGIALDRIVNEALIAAMDIVGKKFADAEIYVPEMLVSAVTMKKGLGIIKPLLKENQTESKGSILLGTVKGDLHDIGKNLVVMMLEGAGFHVVDLGVDLSVEKVVQQVEEVKPEILGLSALLTTTMPEMEKVIEALEERGLRNSVKVIVGGAPLDARFAEKIGADCYGRDAVEAVEISRRFVGAK